MILFLACLTISLPFVIFHLLGEKAINKNKLGLFWLYTVLMILTLPLGFLALSTLTNIGII